MGLSYAHVFAIGHLVIQMASLALYASAMTAMSCSQEFKQVRAYMLSGRQLRQAEPLAVEALSQHDIGLGRRLEQWFERYEALVAERNRIVHSVGVKNLDGPQPVTVWHPRTLTSFEVTAKSLEITNAEAGQLVSLGFELAADIETSLTGESTLRAETD